MAENSSEKIDLTDQSPWISKTELSFFQRQAAKILISGAVPKHVAFIMDGNRRWARKNGFDEVLVGHKFGFEQLSKVLKYCSDLGITTVTVYALSLENFRRSKSEVDGLMQLAREKFKQLLGKDELLVLVAVLLEEIRYSDVLAELRIAHRLAMQKHGVRMRIFGDLSQLPDDLTKLISRAQLETEKNTKCTLNVCLAYTGQNEMLRGVQKVLGCVQDGTIDVSEINESILSHCMDLCPDEKPNLLIRTSGEKRLSDFLLWHITTDETVMHFTDVLWPDFGFWHLAKAILHYQWTLKIGDQSGMIPGTLPTQSNAPELGENEFCSKMKLKSRESLAMMAS